MESVKVKMVDGGRIIVPAAFRKAMGVAPGDTLTLQLDDHGEVRLRPAKTALERLRARLRLLSTRSVVDELIAERRAEAARE